MKNHPETTRFPPSTWIVGDYGEVVPMVYPHHDDNNKNNNHHQGDAPPVDMALQKKQNLLPFTNKTILLLFEFPFIIGEVGVDVVSVVVGDRLVSPVIMTSGESGEEEDTKKREVSSFSYLLLQ